LQDGTVFVGLYDTFYAFDENGKDDGDQGIPDIHDSADLIWYAPLGYAGRSSPVIYNDLVIVGLSISDYSSQSQDGILYAFDKTPDDNGNGIIEESEDEGIPDDGTTYDIIWTLEDGGSRFLTPTVSNGVVYVVESFHSATYITAKLYSLDANTGALIWIETIGPSYSSPAVAEGMVYVGGFSSFYCLDITTGDPVWEYPMSGGSMSSPAVADGKVFIGGMDSILYAFDMYVGGTPIWTSTFTDPIQSSPSIAYGRVYLNGPDGTVYAYD
jgi:outer membrane protein assembly factor BamB